MDNKSIYTFSNKYNPSIDYNIFSEQNSRLLNNNNTNFNYKAQTNNYIGATYFNNTTNLNNSINTLNPSNNNSMFSENYSKFINNRQKTQKVKLIPKIEEENNNINNVVNLNNINNNKKMNLNFIEEFDKIKNIMNNDPSRNPNLKPQDCLDIYGYPFFNQNNGYSFSQFNNAFKQKYLMKTLFDNKYIYINGKQYHRIMKRREMRKKIKEEIEKKSGKNYNNNKIEKNKKYHHESRHLHAMNRERGKGGRFVSKKKLELENNDKKKEDLENRNNKDIENIKSDNNLVEENV